MFTPENDLERSLVRAAEDPAARVPFLKSLLDGELSFALVEAGGGRSEGYEVPEVTDEGLSFVPIFTADSRVKAMFGRERMMVVRQTFRQIIGQVEGANFVLNPGSDYGREIMAEDVAAMLAGDFEKAAESDDSDGAGEGGYDEAPLPSAVVRPSPMPMHLTAPLAKLFADMPEVRAAHVAQSLFAEPDGLKRLVIGLALEEGGDLDEALDRMGEVLDRAAKPTDVIDFVPVPGSPLDSYFERDAAPFYRKA
jgi:hypothetical protein